MPLYTKVVQDHFSVPRNVGPLDAATHRGVGGQPGNGPYVVLWLQVAESTVIAAAYQTYGCPAAIASASALAELVTGLPLSEVSELTPVAVIEALEGLPEGKEHCPRLAIDALQNALAKGA